MRALLVVIALLVTALVPLASAGPLDDANRALERSERAFDRQVADFERGIGPFNARAERDFPGDVSRSTSLSQSFFRDVSFDQDTVFSALALSQGRRIDLDDVADVHVRREVNAREKQDVDVDRDTALFAIALGHNPSRLGRGVLSFADTDTRFHSLQEVDKTVRIDPQNALYALAIDRNPDIDDVASISFLFRQETSFDRDLDLDLDDVLPLVALGR